MQKLINRLICKYRGHDLNRPKAGKEFTQKRVKCLRCGRYYKNPSLCREDISDLISSMNPIETPFFTMIRNNPLSKKSYEWKDISNDNTRKV